MSAESLFRSIGIPVLLVASSLGFCFLMAELGLRLAGFDPVGDNIRTRGLILRPSDDPLRIYELTPGSSGSAWRTDVTINSHGMRDREYPIRHGEALRIAVLGDSVTFGTGTAQDRIFTEQLEEILAQGGGGPVEVLNFGVGGYDTLKEVATLEDAALQFDPDLVILAYCVNDLGDNSPNLDYIQSLEHLDSVLYRLRSVQLVRVFVDRYNLQRRFRLDNQEERFASRFRDQIAPISDDVELNGLRKELWAHLSSSGEQPPMLSWYLSAAHLGRLEYSLSRLEEIAAEHDFDVMVAILPWLEERPGYGIAYRMVEHLSRRHGFQPLNLAPPLAAAGFESLKQNEIDTIHPNDRGHRLIAEALAPAVRDRLDELTSSARDR